jgi:hypothetical protein
MIHNLYSYIYTARYKHKKAIFLKLLLLLLYNFFPSSKFCCFLFYCCFILFNIKYVVVVLGEFCGGGDYGGRGGGGLFVVRDRRDPATVENFIQTSIVVLRSTVSSNRNRKNISINSSKLIAIQGNNGSYFRATEKLVPGRAWHADERGAGKTELRHHG